MEGNLAKSRLCKVNILTNYLKKGNCTIWAEFTVCKGGKCRHFDSEIGTAPISKIKSKWLKGLRLKLFVIFLVRRKLPLTHRIIQTTIISVIRITDRYLNPVLPNKVEAKIL